MTPERRFAVIAAGFVTELRLNHVATQIGNHLTGRIDDLLARFLRRNRIQHGVSAPH
jgi:hypothetical protein